MAEPERPLKTWAEIDASQRQECLCDFSRLTAPLREYKVVARVVAGSHASGGAVIMSRAYWHESLQLRTGGRWMSEDVEVFSAANSFELRRGLAEANDAVESAKKLYEARNT